MAYSDNLVESKSPTIPIAAVGLENQMQGHAVELITHFDCFGVGIDAISRSSGEMASASKHRAHSFFGNEEDYSVVVKENPEDLSLSLEDHFCHIYRQEQNYWRLSTPV
jgi:hypothetical protein